MKIVDVRTFVPCKDFELSKRFYRALGFSLEDAGPDLCLCIKDSVTFFLQKFYVETFAQNFMLQLIVEDIQVAEELMQTLQEFDVRFTEICEEAWGRVIYLHGPSGELWHITELRPQ